MSVPSRMRQNAQYCENRAGFHVNRRIDPKGNPLLTIYRAVNRGFCLYLDASGLY
jgi:hypothetical protein